MSFEFENEGRDIVGISMGGDGAGAKEAMEKKRSDELIFDEVLREQKKINDAANFAERRARQIRAAELLKDECVEILLQENPNLDETSAKIIFENTLKEKIAVEKFMRAYFGQKQTRFDDVHL